VPLRPVDAARTGAARRRYLRRPPSHWLLFGLVLAVLGLALGAHGLAHKAVGGSWTPGNGGDASPGMGPVVDASASPVRSARPAQQQVALTFEDGPDPRWTPEVLDVLGRHGVEATFFVTGSQVAAHPGLARRLVSDGHELGSHTFTHADLAGASPVRTGLELSLTQRVVAGATGVTSSLLRLPYTSRTDQLSPEQAAAARDASARGYLVVGSTHDTEDWRSPGVDQVVAAATPADDAGAVVSFHDGGGDRRQTVAALERVILTLRDQGYTFATVSEVAGIDRPEANTPVGTAERAQGLAFLAALRTASATAWVLNAVLVPVGVLVLLRAFVLLAFARRHAGRSREESSSGTFQPSASIIVPAYNEEAGIAAAVRSLAGSRYPEFEVIVIDDGSTDGTAEIVAGLDEPGVRLLRQANAGKPAALNAGLAAARHDIVVMVDGDTVFEADTLRHMVAPLADPEVGAVSGNTKVGNRSGLIGKWQHVEYVTGFNLDRRMYDLLRCMPTVPGAGGAFRRDALDAVGGVSADTLAEDTDLTMAVNRAGWRVVYEERARSWTEAPADLGGLWRQRYRWCYGTMQSMWKHRRAVRDGSPLGRYGLPYLLLFQVLLPALAPAVDVFAVYGLLFLDPVPVLAYWVVFNLVQFGVGVYAFRLDDEPLGPLWVVPLQQFVYRQLMYLVLIQSLFSAVVGARLGWQKVRRTGLHLPTGAGSGSG
jgi:cellulose synthase/poly-beta-1,6-N-acetylglucosamine synthase-like glycosyltransferase/peptidoglycan/xylan/chitin deacetylase (PgdA/CDA1 family)